MKLTADDHFSIVDAAGDENCGKREHHNWSGRGCHSGHRPAMGSKEPIIGLRQLPWASYSTPGQLHSGWECDTASGLGQPFRWYSWACQISWFCFADVFLQARTRGLSMYHNSASLKNSQTINALSIGSHIGRCSIWSYMRVMQSIHAP